MSGTTARITGLAAGDEAALERFLSSRPDTTMFLRANARAAGFVDAGGPRQATYAAAWEGGDIVAVAAHCWNGILLVEAPVALAEVARAAVRPDRPLSGIIGSAAQVAGARAALGMADRAARMDSREELLALDLDALVVPAALDRGLMVCRRAYPGDLDLLAAWRFAYHREALRAGDDPGVLAAARAEVEEWTREERLWVLENSGRERVAMTGFNARLPDVVQVGGVYTPPELRGRGFARAAVAGSLTDARALGARRALLFTGDDNAAAGAAYRSLGFEVVGDYGMLLFEC